MGAVPVKKPAAVVGAVEPASGMKVVVGEVLSDEGQADEAALKAVDDDLSKMMDQPHHTTESDTAESFVEQVKESDAEEKETKEDADDHVNHPVMLDEPQEDEE